MKKTSITKTIFLGALGALLFVGCSTSTQYISSDNSKGGEKAPLTMGIDSRDFEKAATTMITSMLESGVLNNKDGGRYVVMMSDIVNDTTQRINTRMLTQKIKRELLRSGKVVFTNAIGTQRDDITVVGSREIRGNEEFDQSTVSQKGTLIGADLGLAGRIIQKTSKANSGDQVVEYYFQMELTNAKNGLEYWLDEIIIGKLGSNDTVVW